MTTKPPKIGIDETAYASNQGTIQTDGTQPSETNSYPRHSDSVNGTYPGEPEEKRLKRLSETNETLLKVPHLSSHELDTLSSPNHNTNYTPYLKEFDEQSFCYTDPWGIRKLHTNRDTTDEVKSFLFSSIERARREGGVEAIEMVVDEEMIDQWQRNVYLKMWREKSEF